MPVVSAKALTLRPRSLHKRSTWYRMEPKIRTLSMKATKPVKPHANHEAQLKKSTMELMDTQHRESVVSLGNMTPPTTVLYCT